MSIPPDPLSVIRLLAWLSPAFPTGAYACSQGLEWAVGAGDVADGPTLRLWLEDVLGRGAGRADAVLLRHAHRAGDSDTLVAVAAHAEAAASTRERRIETLGQGAAFVEAAREWPAPRLSALSARIGHARIAYPVAVGVLASAHAVEEELAVTAYLHALSSNLISAAVRLVPLGQKAGLAVLASLEACILETARSTREAALEDIGSACFRADIASMRHETQYTRLFRT